MAVDRVQAKPQALPGHSSTSVDKFPSDAQHESKTPSLRATNASQTVRLVVKLTLLRD